MRAQAGISKVGELRSQAEADTACTDVVDHQGALQMIAFTRGSSVFDAGIECDQSHPRIPLAEWRESRKGVDRLEIQIGACDHGIRVVTRDEVTVAQGAGRMVLQVGREGREGRFRHGEAGRLRVAAENGKVF